VSKVLHGDIGRQVRVAKEAMAMRGRFMKGRQVLCMVYPYFRVSAEERAALDFQDLLSLELSGNDIRGFTPG
jgi:hypothetical protein